MNQHHIQTAIAVAQHQELDQAADLMREAIDLQHQAILLLKQATSLEMQAAVLLSEQGEPHHRQAPWQRRAEDKEDLWQSYSCQDDEWDTWVSAHFVFAGDA